MKINNKKMKNNLKKCWNNLINKININKVIKLKLLLNKKLT